MLPSPVQRHHSPSVAADLEDGPVPSPRVLDNPQRSPRLVSGAPEFKVEGHHDYSRDQSDLRSEHPPVDMTQGTLSPTTPSPTVAPLGHHPADPNSLTPARNVNAWPHEEVVLVLEEVCKPECLALFQQGKKSLALQNAYSQLPHRSRSAVHNKLRQLERMYRELLTQTTSRAWKIRTQGWSTEKIRDKLRQDFRYWDYMDTILTSPDPPLSGTAINGTAARPGALGDSGGGNTSRHAPHTDQLDDDETAYSLHYSDSDESQPGGGAASIASSSHHRPNGSHQATAGIGARGSGSNGSVLASPTTGAGLTNGHALSNHHAQHSQGHFHHPPSAHPRYTGATASQAHPTTPSSSARKRSRPAVLPHNSASGTASAGAHDRNSKRIRSTSTGGGSGGRGPSTGQLFSPSDARVSRDQEDFALGLIPADILANPDTYLMARKLELEILQVKRQIALDEERATLERARHDLERDQFTHRRRMELQKLSLDKLHYETLLTEAKQRTLSLQWKLGARGTAAYHSVSDHDEP